MAGKKYFTGKHVDSYNGHSYNGHSYNGHSYNGQTRRFAPTRLLFFRIVLGGGLLPILYLFILYSLSNSCAQQQPLTGGKRDTIPPKLIVELSTPNFQTNFKKQTIELVFDEFIEITNVNKQVVISPPLNSPIPKVDRKKGFKTAQFKFSEKDSLKEGVTYAINFGESIKDLTEGNKVKNLQFLFSTGDYIDSLKISGEIKDVLTSKPVPDVLFMLYENFADTVVRTEKPYYFGKTDKDGKFTINYLKAGSFKGFALKDENLDYLFNLPKEKIGFSLDSIIISDSTANILINLFEEETVLEKPKVDATTHGFVKMSFRRAPYDAVITYDSVGQELYQEIEGDTIRYWYDLKDSVNWNFYLQRDTILDTFKIKALPKGITPITLSQQKNKEDVIPINPFKSASISFNYPIKHIDTALINFRKLVFLENSTKDSLSEVLTDSLSTKVDSLQITKTDTLKKKIDSTTVSIKQKGIKIAGDFSMDSLNKRTLTLAYNWEENVQYQLELLPGAIIDWYDEPNKDTILLTYKVKPKNDFGTINLTVTAMDSTQNYWFQLLLKENVVETFLVSGTKEYKQLFSALSPGQYSLKVIEDLNGNGRWDSGNYDKKLQPEKISIATIEELRAGWDVEADVEIKF